MTGPQFTETYFIRDGNKQAFLVIGRLLVSTRYGGLEREKDIFLPGVNRKIINTEGDIPAIVTRIRFMNAIHAAGDNEARVFCLLNQLLTEDAIKELFPEVWLQWHNQMAKRSANRAVQELRRSLKDKVHRDVIQITRNKSVRKSAHLSRIFT